MSNWKKEYKYDLYFYGKSNGVNTNSLKFKLFDKSHKIIKLMRKLNDCGKITRLLLKIRIKRYSKYLTYCYPKNVGHGFMIGHCGNIVINPNVVFGNYISISNGVTIGNIKNGEKAGCPKIGSNVVINANAVIVGGITIGDNVLIAPNSFVNFDVPSNSIVLGNPGMIISKENPTFNHIATIESFESLYGRK